MLQVDGVHIYYGESHVLQGLSFHVDPGEIVAVLGRNGAGKTTFLNAVMGALPVRRGTIGFDGENLAGKRPYEIARRGIGYVPQGRQIFGSLSMIENL